MSSRGRQNTQTAQLAIKKFDIQEMQLNSKVAIIGKPGCFAKDTPVLMWNGQIKPVQDIMPGELVMGDNDHPRRVLELRRGFEQMVKITPKFGDPIVVNKTHILVIANNKTDEVREVKATDFLTYKDQDDWLWLWKKVRVFNQQNAEDQIGITRAWRLGREASSGVIDTIPRLVKMGAFTIRDNFMRGLLVFHPSCEEDGIIEVGEHLITDILFIARSVGYLCKAISKSKIHFHFNKPTCMIDQTSNQLIPGDEIARASFQCTLLPDEDEYYGFVVDGNHRFLLGDFSIVRNTGKSTLMKDLLYKHRARFPIGLVLSETNKESGDFAGLVPPLFTYDYYNQTAMDNLVLRQRRMVRKNGEGDARNFAFVIVDDCMDDTSWVNHKTTKGIFKNGRHWDLFFLLSMQYCLGIPPTLRTCLDYVFLLREPNLRNRKQLWENYASIFPTFDMFCDALDDLTANYNCMVIKNRVLSNKIEDVVFWYKATRHEPFRVGTESWWRWAEQHYNERYEQEEEEQQLAAQRQDSGGILYNHKRGRNKGIKLRVRMEP